MFCENEWPVARQSPVGQPFLLHVLKCQRLRDMNPILFIMPAPVRCLPDIARPSADTGTRNPSRHLYRTPCAAKLPARCRPPTTAMSPSSRMRMNPELAMKNGRTCQTPHVHPGPRHASDVPGRHAALSSCHVRVLVYEWGGPDAALCTHGVWCSLHVVPCQCPCLMTIHWLPNSPLLESLMCHWRYGLPVSPPHAMGAALRAEGDTRAIWCLAVE